MNDKKVNEEKVKTEFETRIRETKQQAIEDNKKKAVESGNLLTQTMTSDGNLVNVKNITDEELDTRIAAPDPSKQDKTIASADVAADMFSDENIDTNSSTYSVD